MQILEVTPSIPRNIYVLKGQQKPDYVWKQLSAVAKEPLLGELLSESICRLLGCPGCCISLK